MGYLFAVLAVLFPRAADIILWITRPERFLAPFDGNRFWPVLGIIFLPFTTLMYVFRWRPGVGLGGFDWVWLVIAVLLDGSHAIRTGYANRDRVPGMAPA